MSYENSSVPLSLFKDGSMLLLENKAEFMHKIEKHAKVSKIKSAQNVDAISLMVML